MGLDMSLYRIPKTEYPLNTIRAANEFVRYVCDEDFPKLFTVWYEDNSDHLPSMKTIYSADIRFVYEAIERIRL